MRAADIARELHDMTPERRAEVASALDDQKLADALEELPEDEQVQLISELDTERAADILEEMDPDDAADLIAELAPELAERLLRPDGAGGGPGRPPAAELRRVHRRRHDDAGAGDPAAGRHRGRRPGPDPGLRAHPGAGLHGLRLPGAAGDPDRALHRRGALPAAAPRAAVDPGLGAGRHRAGDPHRRRQPARGEPLLRDVQPGQRAGRGRRAAADRRGHRRRRARPRAAGGLARPQLDLLSSQATPIGGAGDG